MSDKDKLNQLRQQIDDLDEKLLSLINQRAEIAKQIAKVKTELSDDQNPKDFYRPERETQIIRKMLSHQSINIHKDDLLRIYREIISACLALESSMNIGYLGPEGTFSQSATLKHFGHAIKATSMTTIKQVFIEVEKRHVHYGVVPFENSTEGIVNQTLDLLIERNLFIVGEIELKIHQHLIGKTQDLTKIHCIYSHQQSIAQCRAWLNEHLPNVRQVMTNSNAEAAQLAAKEEDVVAIASEEAAELYGLNIIANNIESEPNNTTRFLVIGTAVTLPSGEDKASLLFSTSNKPGALYNLLGIFDKHKVNMTRIQSRPSRRKNYGGSIWNYDFFVDIDGHQDDQHIAQLLLELHEHATIKLLGSYPRAILT